MRVLPASKEISSSLGGRIFVKMSATWKTCSAGRTLAPASTKAESVNDAFSPARK